MTLQEERDDLVKKKKKLEEELHALNSEIKEVEEKILKEKNKASDPKDNFLTW